jgi:hypothetical protein
MMTEGMPSTGPPPGWYADSPTSMRMRWWNGSAWTDHYQGSTESVEAVAPVVPPALRRDARPRVPPHPPAPERSSAPPQAPAAVPDPEPFPDQILDRAPRAFVDRPLPPVTYRPPPGSPSNTMRTTFIPAESKNGPAKASLILILISLLGGVAVFWWLSGANPALIGLVNLINVSILLAAFILAIISLVIAVQRPTRKREPVFALVMSSLLIIGMIVLFAIRVVVAVPLATLNL